MTLQFMQGNRVNRNGFTFHIEWKMIYYPHTNFDKKGFGNIDMDFMGKKLEDIVVTLPFADGTSMDCGVYSYFELMNKKYFALLPLKGEKELDFSASYMLYEVEEDEEHNPIILYIEDDMEYAVVAQYFSQQLPKKN